VSGEIVGVNEAVTENPEVINNDPYGAGWLFKIKMQDPAEAEELITADQYEESVPDEE
jgi:glycine cleavage system H protein